MGILMTEDLSKVYYINYNCIHAITNCNLEIGHGEFVAITGPGASGKTTLLRMLGGLERPTNGRIYLEQRDIYSLNNKELSKLYRKALGFVFQDYQLISGLTIYDNIIMPTLINRDKLDEDFLYELTDTLHITGILNHYPKNITEEQRHCTAIARALINQPEIILADEPTRNLNRCLSKDILDLLMNYISWFRRTLVMVTSDPDISIFADHIIKLDMGKVVTDLKIRK